jgi:uncharacterized iron-regulated protein
MRCHPHVCSLLPTLAACGSIGLGPSEAPLQARHPLVGSIWSRGEGAPIDAVSLDRRVASARFLLLGEIHDNPDQHRIQARFVDLLAAGPRPPAVVFEMLDHARQPEIDAFLAEGLRDPDAFAARVRWQESGWPPFALYRPLFEATLRSGLPILAAGLPRGRTSDPTGPETDPRFGLAVPLPPEEQAARIEQMFASHCELIPRDQLGPMLAMQRARDARLAEAVLRGEALAGAAVLVAGGGHVKPGGVPSLLERVGIPRPEILSIGLLEVAPEHTRVEDTDADRFDVAIFTPAAGREDPCERLRRRLGGSAGAAVSPYRIDAAPTSIARLDPPSIGEDRIRPPRREHHQGRVASSFRLRTASRFSCISSTTARDSCSIFSRSNVCQRTARACMRGSATSKIDRLSSSFSRTLT